MRKDETDLARELYEPAGEAAGLLISPAAGLASVEASGAGVAASGAAEAEASGAGADDSLLQAMAAKAKNVEIRPRIKNLRITSSFKLSALASGAAFLTRQQYFRLFANTMSRQLHDSILASHLLLAHDRICNYRAVSG